MRDVTAPWFKLPDATGRDVTGPDATGKTADEPVIVVGAGLAGAAIARGLAERERPVIVLEAGSAVASGASGNPAGVVKPFVTRDESPVNGFYRFTHQALMRLLDSPGWADRCGFRRCGVLQLINSPYPERPDYQVLDASAASTHAGQRLSSPALWFADGGWLDPALLCRALLDHPLIDCRVNARVARLQQGEDDQWTVHLQRDGSEDQCHCRQLVLASGTALTRLPVTENLPLTPARGQLSQFARIPGGGELNCVVSGRHYALPGKQDVFVGATFERDDVGLDIRSADHRSNLLGLHGLLPGLVVESAPVSGRAGVRATTPDRLPMLGPAPDITGYAEAYTGLQHGQSAAHFPPAPLHRGLYVFGGLGSRGINVATGCGQLLASHLSGDSAPLQAWSPLLHPARFCVRALRRAG